MTVNHTHIRADSAAHGAVVAYARLLRHLNEPPARAVLHCWLPPALNREWRPPMTPMDASGEAAYVVTVRDSGFPRDGTMRASSLPYSHHEISHKEGWALFPARWALSACPFSKLRQRYVRENAEARDRARLAQRTKGRRGAVETTRRLISWLKDATTHDGRHGTIFVDQVLNVIDGIATGANEHGADWCPTGTHGMPRRENGSRWLGYFAATLGKDDDDRTTIYAVIEFHDSRYGAPGWARRENMHDRKRRHIRTDGGAIMLTGARVSPRAKRMARRGPGIITGRK